MTVLLKQTQAAGTLPGVAGLGLDLGNFFNIKPNKHLGSQSDWFCTSWARGHLHNSKSSSPDHAKARQRTWRQKSTGTMLRISPEQPLNARQAIVSSFAGKPDTEAPGIPDSRVQALDRSWCSGGRFSPSAEQQTLPERKLDLQLEPSCIPGSGPAQPGAMAQGQFTFTSSPFIKTWLKSSKSIIQSSQSSASKAQNSAVAALRSLLCLYDFDSCSARAIKQQGSFTLPSKAATDRFDLSWTRATCTLRMLPT